MLVLLCSQTFGASCAFGLPSCLLLAGGGCQTYGASCAQPEWFKAAIDCGARVPRLDAHGWFPGETGVYELLVEQRWSLDEQ